MKRNPIDVKAAELAKLARAEGDPGLAELMLEFRARRKLPIERILAKVPGDTVVAKCKRLGVTRQAWYDWVRGTYRPMGELAKRMAKITGYSAEAIEGTGAALSGRKIRPKSVPKRKKRKARPRKPATEAVAETAA